MIIYDEPVYRPPSEARSLIIQASLGCSHNRCIFCGMYKGKTFKIRSLEDIKNDIEGFSGNVSVSKVFLADGDALALDTEMLLKILELLYKNFPKLERVSIYANPGNILKKTLSELESLKAAGLKLLYYGIESGSDLILKKVKKGALFAHHKEAILKAHDAGFGVSATIVTGLGGQDLWQEHIEQSARLVSESTPDYLSTLSLMMDRASLSEFKKAFGEDFTEQDDEGMLREDRLLISEIEPQHDLVFRSNHASNALALKGTLPEDGDNLLATIDAALDGKLCTRPGWMRGL
ncbi:MAG: radical SAM protein [Spirochaetales bacterium]|nr:radical SAM protein [Spirochaetales bacterium]